MKKTQGKTSAKGSEGTEPRATKTTLRKTATDPTMVWATDYTLRRAIFGIRGDAKQVLEQCAMFLEEGIAPPKPYAQFLAWRFKKIAAQEDPFGKPIFSRRKGQKGRDQYDRQHLIAIEVFLLHTRAKLPLRSDSKSEGALEKAATKFNVTKATALKHYRKFLPQLKR